MQHMHTASRYLALHLTIRLLIITQCFKSWQQTDMGVLQLALSASAILYLISFLLSLSYGGFIVYAMCQWSGGGQYNGWGLP